MSFRDRAEPGNTCWFSLDGQLYRVEIDTPLLLDVLTGTASYTRLVPGATDDPWGLWERLLDPDDAFDLPDCEAVTEGVIAHLTGWLPHAAYALAGLVDAQWPVISGKATAGGVDLLELPVRRVLDFAYAVRVEYAEEKDRNELDRALFTPRITARRPRRRAVAADADRQRPAAGDGAAPPGFSVAEQQGSFMSAMGMIGAAQS